MMSDEVDVDDHEVVEDEFDGLDDIYFNESDEFEYPEHKNEEFSELDKKSNGTEVLTLQDICLLSISKNILRFNLAFTTTEDSNFRRNLLFLQRVHSSYLIKAATKYNEKLNESYFDFLLNQYIKEFDMNVLYECDWDIVIKRMSEIGHGFQKVRFNFPERSNFEKNVDFLNKVVCHLPNVEILDLNPHCNDSTLEIVASSCPQLKELYIDDCNVTNKGLKSLCQVNAGNESCLNLKHLSVLGVFNPDDGIAYLLQNMPSLEVIVHHDLPYILYEMHKDSMNNTLDKKYNLTSLFLGANSPWDNTPINDILTLYANICPHIKKLSLALNSKKQLDLCSKFQEIEEFSACNVDDNITLDINDFLKSKGEILQRLHLEKFTLSIAVLRQNCPKLESLTLKYMTFKPKDPGTILKPLNNLQEVSLGYFILSNALVGRSVIDIFNSSQKIEKLTLLHMKFINNEEFVNRFSKFCENETLKYLIFSYCDVSGVFLQSVLLTCSNLKILIVEHCDKITSAHMDNLCEIANSIKSKTKIIWYDDRSDSIDSGDDYLGLDTDDYDTYNSDII